MIEKIYNRKEKYWDILISGQDPDDIGIDGCYCWGGIPKFRCFCDLEMLKNETGVGFPNDVTLDINLDSDQHFIENIIVYRSHRRRNITISYSLYRRPLDKHDKNQGRTLYSDAFFVEGDSIVNKAQISLNQTDLCHFCL
ncbi:hypothetical protein [Desulfobacter sp. UBA2225]|uniref:hypothetical protein n=1 Tax=Desulfobacter sp. UBA2225 TaxID=1961413 RepID=UPI00257C892E|nr:hypothetical protein [Desulfobacter sp. UBA2225]